ncbi:MAG: ABC transporter permease subunit [Candidatus Bathyarchaeia archaeon]
MVASWIKFLNPTVEGIGSTSERRPPRQSRLSTVVLIILFFIIVTALASYIWLKWIFIEITTSIAKYPDIWNIPYYVARTLLRMTVAYIFVLAFGLTYGIAAGMFRRLSHVLIPMLDILQSVPVLGYLPAAVIFFVETFHGSEIGLELASILLIFTGMAWAVAFGVISGVKTIPNDVIEAARVFGLRGFKYLRHIVFPAIYPSLIAGSILAWGGGWYFLIACEYIQYGDRTYWLPGLGAFLDVYGDETLAIFGLIVLASVIAVINRLVWHPLMEHSEKYKYE